MHPHLASRNNEHTPLHTSDMCRTTDLPSNNQTVRYIPYGEIRKR